MSEKKTEPQETPRYGIGEWYGRPLINITGVDRRRLAGETGSRKVTELCPFRQSSTPGATCNKKGGVCTLQSYERKSDGGVTPSARTADLVTVCPSRFWEGNVVFKAIGKALLDCARPTIVKEVGFLESLDEASDRDVGRIDTVLIDPTKCKLDWCAVEIQAVYFSGDTMSREFDQLKKVGDSLPFPSGKRRPDFRSSGPKRLMPQLQIKVPTLRRWGKKMAVVVDQPFFSALGKMSLVKDISNADIAWFVVRYSRSNNRLQVSDTCYTTLESSVEALTAGQAVTKDQFESEISKCLKDKRASKRGKVIQVL